MGRGVWLGGVGSGCGQGGVGRGCGQRAQMGERLSRRWPRSEAPPRHTPIRAAAHPTAHRPHAPTQAAARVARRLSPPALRPLLRPATPRGRRRRGRCRRARRRWRRRALTPTLMTLRAPDPNPNRSPYLTPRRRWRRWACGAASPAAPPDGRRGTCRGRWGGRVAAVQASARSFHRGLWNARYTSEACVLDHHLVGQSLRRCVDAMCACGA